MVSVSTDLKTKRCNMTTRRRFLKLVAGVVALPLVGMKTTLKRVKIVSGGTLPAGLSKASSYYVTGRAATYKLGRTVFDWARKEI